WPGPEAPVAALADDIAYNNHDIDDGLRAGLFPIEDLADVPLVGPVFADLAAAYPGIDSARLTHDAVRRQPDLRATELLAQVRRLIDLMATDLIEETRRRLAEAKPASVDALRRLGTAVVSFSPEMRENDRALKAFLFERMYRHYKVNRMTNKARRVVRELFELYVDQPDCLPPEWYEQSDGPQTPTTARLVADYIAGMTDRYALEEHRRLFDIYDRSR